MDTLVDLLRESASRFGERDALLFKPGFRTQKWTFGQMFTDSAAIAGYLTKRGVQKGDRVIIWAANRPEWALSLFGTLMAGGVAVPLDVRSTPEFVGQIVESTSPKMAFTWRSTTSELRQFEVPSVDLDDVKGLVYSNRNGLPRVSVKGDDLAGIMFTSGTTGNPKGVMLTHENILSNVQSAQSIVPTEPPQRLLSLLPLSHMLEQSAGLFGPILAGSSVVYPVSRQPSILIKTMEEQKVTMMVVVPQALQLFMNAIEREVKGSGKEALWNKLLSLGQALPMGARRLLFRSVHKKFGGRLRYVGCGGAYLDPALGEKWEALGVMVLQGYGSTEASPFITSNTYKKRRLDSIGLALPGQEVRIAQDGEILARGQNITPGYWRNPEATDSILEDGWYKTGDLGDIDEEGFVYFRGRKKDLIVLPNGQNVFPDDIENLLRLEPGVIDAAVVGLSKDGPGIEVHAVLLLDAPDIAASLVRSVNSKLASHQQIANYTLWPDDDFPRTHTLKVRKNLVIERLHAITKGVDEHNKVAGEPAEDTAELTPLQSLVQSMTATSPSEISPEKNLGYDLGLDSLGRVELLSGIEQELGVYVDESQVGPETTIGDLERLVGAGNKAPKLPFPSWGRNPAVRMVRALLQYGLVFPFMRIFYELKATGRENLDGLKGPVLFAANHNVKLDNPAIFASLPVKWLWNLSPAAAADDMFGHPGWRFFAPLLGNAFPFSRDVAVRASLENLGRLMDQGWSILIFPEGYSTRGDIQPFKAGTGLIATESHSPVVPIRVLINRNGMFEGKSILSRGSIEVRIGKPLLFPPGTSLADATALLEEAVRAL